MSSSIYTVIMFNHCWGRRWDTQANMDVNNMFFVAFKSILHKKDENALKCYWHAILQYSF